jgi:hypothetical protein
MLTNLTPARRTLMESLFGLFALIVVTVLLALYFLPTIVAALGHKRKTGAIFVLNLLLGWTLLGWVGSLVWAIADERSETLADLPPRLQASQQPGPPAQVTASSATGQTWRPLPTPGQRVHLMANRILHVEPAVTARSTGELRAGMDVTVVNTNSGWAWVRSEQGTEGWIEL